jgi:hypothetical protein
MVVVNLKYVNCDVDSFDSFHTVTKLVFFFGLYRQLRLCTRERYIM